jgi:hypothetical protein
VGGLNVGGLIPNTKLYWQSSMYPINVHWHLGSKHYSYGKFNKHGNGPHGSIPRPKWADCNLSATGIEDVDVVHQVQDGFHCHHYNATDAMCTTPFNWQHCKGMEVGKTYEVH